MSEGALSEQNSSSLRRLDRLIFNLEQRLVTIAAILMTTSVCLDIIYRSLKGQQSEPFVTVMNLFGVIGEPSTGLEVSYHPVMTLIVVPFFFGWAVYASLHRGEEGSANTALKHGGGWTIGALITAVLIYQLQSRYVCLLLVLIIGSIVSYQSAGLERIVNCGLTGLVAWASLSLPQGYIWSQELSLILLAWVAFLGASMATFQNKHIQISALAGLIPSNLKPYVRPFGLIITSIFCAYITTSLTMSVFGDKGSFMSGEVRPATGIPAWVILFSGVISFGLITARSFAYGIWGLLHPDQQTEEERFH